MRELASFYRFIPVGLVSSLPSARENNSHSRPQKRARLLLQKELAFSRDWSVTDSTGGATFDSSAGI